MNDDDPRHALALTRYQAISAFLVDDLPHGQRAARLAQLAARTWPGPDVILIRNCGHHPKGMPHDDDGPRIEERKARPPRP